MTAKAGAWHRYRRKFGRSEIAYVVVTQFPRKNMIVALIMRRDPISYCRQEILLRMRWIDAKRSEMAKSWNISQNANLQKTISYPATYSTAATWNTATHG